MDTSARYLEIAREFATELRRRLASGVRDILLYGSVARGTATEASDIDVLVVYSDEDSKNRQAPLDVASDMMARHNTLIAVLDCSPSEYERLVRFPFGWQVMKEGVRL